MRGCNERSGCHPHSPEVEWGTLATRKAKEPPARLATCRPARRPDPSRAPSSAAVSSRGGARTRNVFDPSSAVGPTLGTFDSDHAGANMCKSVFDPISDPGKVARDGRRCRRCTSCSAQRRKSADPCSKLQCETRNRHASVSPEATMHAAGVVLVPAAHFSMPSRTLRCPVVGERCTAEHEIVIATQRQHRFVPSICATTCAAAMAALAPASPPLITISTPPEPIPDTRGPRTYDCSSPRDEAPTCRSCGQSPIGVERVSEEMDGAVVSRPCQRRDNGGVTRWRPPRRPHKRPPPPYAADTAERGRRAGGTHIARLQGRGRVPRRPLPLQPRRYSRRLVWAASVTHHRKRGRLLPATGCSWLAATSPVVAAPARATQRLCRAGRVCHDGGGGSPEKARRPVTGGASFQKGKSGRGPC